VIVALLKLFAAATNRAAVDFGHRLKERRVKLDRMFSFPDTEFRNRRIKRHLEPLQENRVKNSTLGSSPGKNPVAQNQFNSFGFAFGPAVEFVERFKDA
jgi:hypothetical protein